MVSTATIANHPTSFEAAQQSSYLYRIALAFCSLVAFAITVAILSVVAND
jgi:hypothetical protein